MTRFRNDTGQVLISLDFGVIGPGELVAEHYDPVLHGVIPGCTRVEDEPESGPEAVPPDATRKRGSKAAVTGTEAGE